MECDCKLKPWVALFFHLFSKHRIFLHSVSRLCVLQVFYSLGGEFSFMFMHVEGEKNTGSTEEHNGCKELQHLVIFCYLSPKPLKNRVAIGTRFIPVFLAFNKINNYKCMRESSLNNLRTPPADSRIFAHKTIMFYYYRMQYNRRVAILLSSVIRKHVLFLLRLCFLISNEKLQEFLASIKIIHPTGTLQIYEPLACFTPMIGSNFSSGALYTDVKVDLGIDKNHLNHSAGALSLTG